MYTIIKHIPATMTAEQLAEFVQPAIKGRFFQKAGKIKAIKLMTIKDKDGNSIEYHALIRVCLDSVKKRMIKFINSQTIKKHNHQKLMAQDFITRHWSNDRRTNIHESARNIDNHRRFDRRRSGIRFVTVAEIHFAKDKPVKIAHVLEGDKSFPLDFY